jgi:hypothetical protein
LALLLLLGPRVGWGEEKARPLTPEERETVRMFFDRKTDVVEELLRKGRFEKALRLAEALLVLAPDVGQNPVILKALKNKARDGLQAGNVVQGEIRGPEGFTQVGDRILLKVVITNVGGTPITVQMGEEEEERGAATLRISFEERGCMGGVRVDEWSVPVTSLTGTRLLEPGKSWESEVVLDSADRSPVNPTIRTYRISGEIWPLSLRVGPRALHRPIQLEETKFDNYPRGLAPLRQAPLETLKEGVEEEFGPKVFLAAHFLSGPQVREAVTYLAESQEREFDHPAIRRTMRVALRVLTGRKDLPLDSVAWRRWWAEHGAGVLESVAAKAREGKKGKPGEKEGGNEDE